MKKIIVVLMAVVSLFLMKGAISYGQEDVTAQASAPAESAAVNVGNKICPVSGDKINEETKATYEYEGKIYNFCCPACIDEFKKEPQKYIKKIEEEKQKEMQPEAEKQDAGSMHKDQHSH